MFFTKIGYIPSMWYEYYYGSEEAGKYFFIQDSYKEPLTPNGRIKTLYSHLIAYGILIFTITHLIRSINTNKSLESKINNFCMVFFAIGFFEILADFFLVLIQSFNFYVKIFFLYIRFFLFLGFVLITLLSILIFFLILKKQKIEFQ
ncbi:MAG: hypothetical protein ACK4UJ_11550 [Leptonema sp. (in: bacteria)]